MTSPPVASSPATPAGGAGPVLYPIAGQYGYRMVVEHGGNRLSSDDVVDQVEASGERVVSRIRAVVAAMTYERTNTYRWTRQGAWQLDFSASGTAQPSQQCTFDPPQLFVRFPLRPGPYEPQVVRSVGDSCGADTPYQRVEIEVKAPESVTDASGRQWRAWPVRTVIWDLDEQRRAVGDQEPSRETTWLAEELGWFVQTRVEQGDEVQTFLLRTAPGR